jgi:glycosyl transferase family 2
MPMATRVSVVVASVGSLELLSECLESLRSQCRDLHAEVVVARAAREADVAFERVAHWCRRVSAPADAALPLVRGLGLDAAIGEWVAVTEDNCLADADWLPRLLAGAGSGAHVLGGRVGNARRERRIDRGAYYAEYGIYGPGPGRARRGAAPLVTGANAAYHRSVVPSVAAWARGGLWEHEIHDRLHAAGHSIQVVPGARVRQNARHRLGAFCRDRYAHGRGFAAVRAGGRAAWRRMALLIGTPALPVLLAARIARAVDAEERRYFAGALPATLLFLGAWALGEAAGYLRGSPAR